MRYAGRPSAAPPAYDLPATDDLPKLQSLRFVKGTGEMKTKEITERDQKANNESVACQADDVDFRAAPRLGGTSDAGS